MKTGKLDEAVREHKYDGVWQWGIIFARVLLGYLPRWPLLGSVDLIIPMPAYLQQGLLRRGNDQAGWTLQSAQEQDDVGYPIRVDPPVIVKTAPTEKMASTRSLGERQAVARTVSDVLQVVDAASIRGRTVAVYDDVFTTGTTLNTVARRLREAGASKVYGLTLSRAPWR